MATPDVPASGTHRPAHDASGVDESAIYRKVTRRLLPFLVACYVVAYLDRVNVGFAKLQMLGDLGFSETVYGFGAGVFFLGYFVFEVPSNVILHRVGARVWIARIMITWGLVSGAFVFVGSPAQFYVMRFLLGLAEAGFFPGVILYFTYWYPAARRAQIIATFMAAIPLSGVFGGPLSGWIMEALAGRHGLTGWQWMFLVEAVARARDGRGRAVLSRQRHPGLDVADAAGEGPARATRRRGRGARRRALVDSRRVRRRSRVVDGPHLLLLRGRPVRADVLDADADQGRRRRGSAANRLLHGHPLRRRRARDDGDRSKRGPASRTPLAPGASRWWPAPWD